MSDDAYCIDFDVHSGRAYVEAEGNISSSKIKSTFFAITMNDAWQKSDRSIIWNLKNATFPESFEFGKIFQTAQVTKNIANPGKSAVLVNNTSEMIRMVADYYRVLAKQSTPREIEIFFSNEEAMDWLDS